MPGWVSQSRALRRWWMADLPHPFVADMERGIVGSMKECGVTESYKLKRQVVLSASEAAEMILRVDDSELHLAGFVRLSC